MNSHFNPFEHVRKLEAVGVPKSQAEIHANTLLQVLDNYAQLNDLKREVGSAMTASEAQLRAELGAVEARLRAEIGASEARLNAKMEEREARQEAKIQKSGTRLMTRLRWANGVLIALSVAILAQGYFR